MQDHEIQEQLNSIWKGWTLILPALGEGRYGKVYQIEREESGNFCQKSALKVISIPKSQSEVDEVMKDYSMDMNQAKSFFGSIKEDFDREIRIMDKFKGLTNIVSYEDHAEVPVDVDGKFGWNIFLRMELLTPLTNKRQLSIDEVIKMGIDICTALEECGKEAIIHRDIKPANILISDKGHYKLADFGVARRLEKTSSNLSQKGTFNYMAPEVSRGDSYNATVDIYSLGLVMYYYLNRQLLPFFPPDFTGKDIEKALSRRMGGETIPAPCNADESLAKIVLKACSADPKKRYATAAEMKRDLQNLINVQTATDDSNRKNAGKKWIVVPVLCGIVAAGCIGFMKHGKTENFTAPDLLNYSMEEAIKIASNQDKFLVVNETGEEYSDTVEKGKIISQSVTAGADVEKWTIIDVVVSKGKQPEIPQLVGESRENAKKAVEEQGLVYEEREPVFSKDYAEGMIVTQEEEAGSKAEEGQTVYVVVSKGKEQTEVPKLLGLSKKEAEQTLLDLGLKYEVTEIYHDSVAAGTVVSQDKNEGEAVESGATVVLEISLGREPTTEAVTEAVQVKKQTNGSTSNSTKQQEKKQEVIEFWEDPMIE